MRAFRGISSPEPPIVIQTVDLHFKYLLTSNFAISFFIQECTDNVPCEGLDTHANFKNFGFAMLTLFRVSTGDNWNGILKVLKFYEYYFTK